MQQGWTRLAVGCLVVFVAAALPYLPGVDAYFLGDDFGYVQFFAQKHAQDLPSLFTTPFAQEVWGIKVDELRPLMGASFELDSIWGAASPAQYHVTNVVLHTSVSLLVLIIGRWIARLSLPASCLAAALFAAHPIHTETVAWITGRADSIAALFYLAGFTFFAYWRKSGRSWAYAIALVASFCALFSKQSAVTLVPALILFDIVVERSRPSMHWRWFRPYAPFLLVLGFYMILRGVVFGQFLREQGLSLQDFARAQGSNAQRLLLDSTPFKPENTLALLSAGMLGLLVVAAVVFVAYRRTLGIDPQRARLFLYFGPVWWVVSTLPLAAAGYTSTRHVYLASAGLIVGLSALTDAWTARLQGLRRTAIWVAALLLVIGAGFRTYAGANDWRNAGKVSRKIATDLQAEATRADLNSLIVVGAPGRGFGRASSLWSWALPYSARPPFTDLDVAERVFLISPMDTYCCWDRWPEDTRASVREWLKAGAGPIVALSWDPGTGRLMRLSDDRHPELRTHALLLGRARSRERAANVVEQMIPPRISGPGIRRPD